MDIGPFIIAIVGLVLIGALVSLPTLAPSIRRWCQRNLAARIATTCILGLVSFVVSFGLATRLEADVAFVFGTSFHVDTFDAEKPAPTKIWPPEAEANKPQVVRELWTRLLVPPVMRRSCYAREAWICDLADDVTPAAWVGRGWGSYMQDVGLGSVSVVTSSVLVWFFTRRRWPSAGAA